VLAYSTYLDGAENERRQQLGAMPRMGEASSSDAGASATQIVADKATAASRLWGEPVEGLPDRVPGGDQCAAAGPPPGAGRATALCVASPAAMPATPIAACRMLSSVLTGMNPRIDSPEPMMKPQIATTT
jgi:hypothetical protein